ncbi:hypothetical protein C8R44DRAFT_884878 [Mycena epipterygia]|nr:hypothetical protein C8R44DRAFT_884878 [Mycena epipterygia]
MADTLVHTEFRDRAYCRMAEAWPIECSPALRSCERVRSRVVIPLELWSLIFEFYCEEAGHDYNAYNHARDELASKLDDWLGFIVNSPLFWTRFTIDCFTVPAHLQYQLSLTGSRMLDVDIVFDESQSVKPTAGFVPFSHLTYAQRHHRLHIMTDCLAVLASQSSLRWRRLFMFSTSVVFTHILVSSMLSVRVPALDSLTLVCPNFGRYETSDVMFGNPSRIFRSSTPKVTYLKLVSASLPWRIPTYYSSLRTLELFRLLRVARPVVADFQAMLSACSVTLHELTIRGPCVLPFEDSELSPLTMHSLVTLSISFRADSEWAVTLLSRISLPLLNRVRFHNSPAHAVHGVVREMSALQQVEFFELSGSLQYNIAASLFSRLKNVVCMDLRLAFEDVLLPLFAAPATVCPLLRVIHPPAVPLDALHLYVKSRSGTPLFWITYHHALALPLLETDVLTLQDLDLALLNFVTVPELSYFYNERRHVGEVPDNLAVASSDLGELSVQC